MMRYGSIQGVSIAQIALAYVMNQPLNVFALVGCRSEAEFKANLAAAELKLSPAEMAWLDLRSDKIIDKNNTEP